LKACAQYFSFERSKLCTRVVNLAEVEFQTSVHWN
jgi:hypothetical protein